MTDMDIRRTVREEMGALFRFSEHGEYQRIRTPFLYPDGDCIGLFCKRDGGGTVVSDLAETTSWLGVRSWSDCRSPEQARLIEEACATHGVEIERGMLQARQRPGESPAAVVIRVAQAALRVSDLAQISDAVAV